MAQIPDKIVDLVTDELNRLTEQRAREDAGADMYSTGLAQGGINSLMWVQRLFSDPNLVQEEWTRRGLGGSGKRARRAPSS